MQAQDVPKKLDVDGQETVLIIDGDGDAARFRRTGINDLAGAALAPHLDQATAALGSIKAEAEAQLDAKLELAEAQAVAAAASAGSLSDLRERITAYPAEDILIALLAADRSRTWLEARESDGGPTDWAMEHLLTRLDAASGLTTKLAQIGEEAIDDLLVAILDAGKRRTWLEAREADGGPSAWAMKHILTRIDALTGLVQKLSATNFSTAPGILAALTDKDGRYTDLTVRAADGQFADFVIDRLAPRIAAKLQLAASTAGMLASDRYMRGNELLPIMPDMTAIAGWGSSSMYHLRLEMAAMATELGTAAGPARPTYVDGARAGEWSTHIFARMGSRPALLSVAGGSIPASGTVTVTASNVAPDASMKSFTGTLAGVAGTLSSTDVAMTFTRTTAGSAVAVAPDTPFIPTLGMANRASVALIWAGKNDATGGQPAADIIARIDQAWDWLAPLNRRALVIGQFIDTSTSAGSTTRATIHAINAANKARYGDRFVDVHSYITSAKLWTDIGMTPTAEDLAAQASGNKPPTISMDSGHFNDLGNAALKNFLIKPRLIALGWYS